MEPGAVQVEIVSHPSTRVTNTLVYARKIAKLHGCYGYYVHICKLELLSRNRL